MTFREVSLTIEGSRDKKQLYHDLLRRATFIIGASGFNAKEIINKFDTKLWPVIDPEKRVTSIREHALATLKKMKEAEQLKADAEKVKNILDGRRGT